MKLFIKSTTAFPTFFRAGLAFTKVGAVYDAEAMTPAQREAIQAEPNLFVREATAEEIAAATPLAEAPDEAIALDALLAAIPQLPNDAFTTKGQPDLAKLRAAAGIDPARVTSDLRDRAMERLIAGGFKVPLTTEKD